VQPRQSSTARSLQSCALVADASARQAMPMPMPMPIGRCPSTWHDGRYGPAERLQCHVPVEASEPKPWHVQRPSMRLLSWHLTAGPLQDCASSEAQVAFPRLSGTHDFPSVPFVPTGQAERYPSSWQEFSVISPVVKLQHAAGVTPHAFAGQLLART
jgi:hypothetical protein